MDAIITFFSYENGGTGLGTLAMYMIMEGYLSVYYKTSFNNKWVRFSVPAFLSYLFTSIICFLISQDIKVFIYPIILPILTVIFEVYQSNQKPNPFFPANKQQRRYPMPPYEVVLILVIVFLMHLLLRANI